MDEYGKCIATGMGVGFGLPLVLLAPLGLASQVSLPGVTQWQEQINGQIAEMNARIADETAGLGLYNEDLARTVNEVNARIAEIGQRFNVHFDDPNVRYALGGLGVVALGLAIGGAVFAACEPLKGEPDGGSNSSTGELSSTAETGEPTATGDRAAEDAAADETAGVDGDAESTAVTDESGEATE